MALSLLPMSGKKNSTDSRQSANPYFGLQAQGAQKLTLFCKKKPMRHTKSEILTIVLGWHL